jgi:hypothetical protein
MGVLNIFDQFSSISCIFFSGVEFSTLATKQEEILGELFHCHNPKKSLVTCTKGSFGKMHKSSHILREKKVRSHDI